MTKDERKARGKLAYHKRQAKWLTAIGATIKPASLGILTANFLTKIDNLRSDKVKAFEAAKAARREEREASDAIDRARREAIAEKIKKLKEEV